MQSTQPGEAKSPRPEIQLRVPLRPLRTSTSAQIHEQRTESLGTGSALEAVTAWLRRNGYSLHVGLRQQRIGGTEWQSLSSSTYTNIDKSLDTV